MRKKAQKKRKATIRRLTLLLCTVLCIIFGAVYILDGRIAPPPNPTEYQIAYNRTPRRRAKHDIKYIVVHDTANADAGADAMHHYRFFNSGNQSSSADYFVDGKTILRINDYYTYYTWHCGDGHGKNGITNQNSIGVEICINRDGNYKQALANTEALVRDLMAELEIDADHVVRHYDASGKSCPAKMQGSSWKQWNAFKERLIQTDS